MPGLLSLASGNFAQYGERRSRAFLVELDKDGSPQTGDGKSLRLQYFPETITDSKGVNFSRREIPGGSLPVYQWVSSGERSLSFTAYFTTDVDVSLGGQSLNNRLASSGLKERNVDIRAAVAWLRHYLLPKYDQASATGAPLVEAPTRLLLIMRNSRLGLAGGITGDHPDHVRCVMTQCDINWEAFFPSGYPRIASVQLAFSQIGQAGGLVTFPTASKMEEYWNTLGFSDSAETKTFGYFLGNTEDPLSG